MSLDFTVEEYPELARAGNSVYVVKQGESVRGASDHEVALWNRMKELESMLLVSEEHCEFWQQQVKRVTAAHDRLAVDLDDALVILRKARAPKRPDGTYNYSREAFEQMANDFFVEKNRV